MILSVQVIRFVLAKITSITQTKCYLNNHLKLVETL